MLILAGEERTRALEQLARLVAHHVEHPATACALLNALEAGAVVVVESGERRSWHAHDVTVTLSRTTALLYVYEPPAAPLVVDLAPVQLGAEGVD